MLTRGGKYGKVYEVSYLKNCLEYEARSLRVVFNVHSMNT